MNYIVNFVANRLDDLLGTVVVCGGDINQLNVKCLEELLGWTALVNFPTRGNSCLDNCLVNRNDLFGKCYSINMLANISVRAQFFLGGQRIFARIFSIKFESARIFR